MGDTLQIELEFRSVGFCREEKTGVPGKKPLGAKTRTNNKLNPLMSNKESKTGHTGGGMCSHHCATPKTPHFSLFPFSTGGGFLEKVATKSERANQRDERK